MNELSAEQYYKILGLTPGASLDQVKKAYRKKARLYHPDLNKREDASDIFIAVNEAYEYLSDCIRKGNTGNSNREEIIREWQRYRREEARKRAYKHSRAKYSEFAKSSTFRTSMVLNKAQLFINLIVAVFILSMAVIGFIIKWNDVDEGYDPPSIPGFVFLLSVGLIFLLVSVGHLQAFYQNTRKIRRNEKND